METKRKTGRPPVLARQVAQFDESPTYQGAPCKRGHDGQRFTANGACVECSAGFVRLRRSRAAYARALASDADDEL